MKVLPIAADLAESSLREAMKLLENPAPESCTLLVSRSEFHIGTEAAFAVGIEHVVIHPMLVAPAWYVEDARGNQAGSKGP